MLVLSRKLAEQICVGDLLRITVVDIDRGKIRLGLEGPYDVAIFRQELLDPPGQDGLWWPPPGWKVKSGHGGMLVLSRKLGEKIRFGRGILDCCITVVDIDRGKIRLGLEAPLDVAIYRPRTGDEGQGQSVPQSA